MMNRRSQALWLGSATLLMLTPAMGRADYQQINLVSDQVGIAKFVDPKLINPWGISSSAASPFWVSDNGTGLSTLYNTAGTPQALVVTIPPTGSPAGAVSPVTGQIFNSTTDFKVNAVNPAAFIFATENGTIAAWAGALGTTAAQKVDNSASGAVYKGLANGTSGGNNFLYAANFNSGNIDVFDKNFAAATLAGAFTDPNAPAGYAPFNVQNIGGKLYVTYAQQDAAKHDDVAGAGHGFVDVYNTDGTFSKRLATGSAAGGTLSTLDSPWGLALAPTGFGEFSSDLLVGNFGDGHINAFDPNSGAFLGQLKDSSGNAIAIDGLWGLIPGNGGNGGSTNKIYFTAGPDGETHGLFGSLQVTPEPGAYATFFIGGLSAAGFLLRRRRKS